MAREYKTVNKRLVESEPSMPGVWKAKEPGLWLVRGRKKNSKTGKLKEVKSFVEARTAKQAYNKLQELLGEAVSDESNPNASNFKEYAQDLLERKKTLGEIRSQAGINKWVNVLTHHLNPVFGDYLMEQITRQDVEAWKLDVARRVQAKEVAPATFNKWLAVMKVIMSTAEIELQLPTDPTRGVKALDNSEGKRFDPRNPNSLPPEKVKEFLARAKEQFPQYYAALYLGFATGLRPSSIRPLRRRGKDADILWDEGILLVRRSHTLGQEAMNRTKTGKDVIIHLPKPVVKVLKWHTENVLLGSRERFSELLFPAKNGKFHGQTWLRKPFKVIGEQLELGYEVTPKSMRRSYQDMARAAKVHDLVTRSISGHSTEAMQYHYSTVNPAEQREAVGKIVKLFG